jgi:diguanylate cyclase (GGDEF)-like protein
VALRAYDEPDAETLDELRFNDGRVFLRHSLPQLVDGQPVGRVWSYQDITAFRQIEKRLREREQALNQARDELAATLEALPDLLFEFNEEGLYLDARIMHRAENKIAPPKAFVGKRVNEVLPAPAAALIMACLQRAKVQGSAYGIEVELDTPNGLRWFELSAARKPTPPDELARFVVIARDITDRKENEALIWEQAYLDTLTGLPNRRMFRERLAQQLMPYQNDVALSVNTNTNANAHAHALVSSRVALFFVDLDRFKEVNDTHGHDVGDLLLQQAAQRIRSCVRETDLVARLGGDEFTLVVTGLDQAEQVVPIARKLLDRLSEPFDLNGEREYISASVGVTICPEDGVDRDTLIRHADQAMYAAKHGGRNRWERFTTALEEAATARARTARDLRTALTAEQFEVVYQPIVDLKTQRIVKAEALLRWTHPQYGEISPALFIPVAEETGLIQEIGQWVFEQATRQVQLWRKSLDPQFQISINQSAVQFRQSRAGDGGRRWTDRLGQLGLPGNSITLEITETVLMDASDRIRTQLTQLHEAGVQLALDDFGTGYSALSYLHQYDLDWLKIDQAFVRHLDGASKDLALCKATVAMAHALGLRVVAEGIETLEQCRLLMELGCDCGQGFLFARPMSVLAFERWFEQYAPPIC